MNTNSDTATESTQSSNKLTPVEFGRLVKIERNRRGLTQQELGEKLFEELGLIDKGKGKGKANSARVAISRIERGLYETDETRVDILAEMLNIQEPKKIADNSYSRMMAELVRVCGRLTTDEMTSVISYANTLLEHREDK